MLPPANKRVGFTPRERLKGQGETDVHAGGRERARSGAPCTIGCVDWMPQFERGGGLVPIIAYRAGVDRR